MRHQFLVVIGALAAVIGASLAPVLLARAQEGTAGATTWTQTKTPWGDPDLQGVWTGITPTPLERDGAGYLGRSLTEEDVRTEKEAAEVIEEIERRYNAPKPAGDPGTYNAFWKEWGTPIKGRTSLIVDPPDGRLPPLTPEALARKAARAAARAAGRGPDGPESEYFTARNRCVNWDLNIDGSTNQHYRIVQAPGYVAMNMERLHENRIIYLDGRPHLPQDVRQWHGDSRGHWEGTTLVVDTTNFTGKATYQMRNTEGSIKNLHLVERFTRVDADTINYEATFDDPMTWTRPWTLALPLTKDPANNEGSIGIYEYACHEGNYSMVTSLGGARADEKAAAEAAKKGKSGASK